MDVRQTGDWWINGLPFMVVWCEKAMGIPGKALEKLVFTPGRALIRAWRREPIRSSFPSPQGRAGQRGSPRTGSWPADRHKTPRGSEDGAVLDSQAFEQYRHSALLPRCPSP